MVRDVVRKKVAMVFSNIVPTVEFLGDKKEKKRVNNGHQELPNETCL